MQTIEICSLATIYGGTVSSWLMAVVYPNLKQPINSEERRRSDEGPYPLMIDLDEDVR